MVAPRTALQIRWGRSYKPAVKHFDPNYFFSVWPAVCCAALALAVACLPVFRVADGAYLASARSRGIDGLRGILALAVVAHHSAIYRAFLLEGVWGAQTTRLYQACGPIAVAMFFMITAYLFWSRIIRQRGRPDWTALLIGRVFRIGPVYVTAILAMCAYIAVADGFVLKTSPAALLNQVTSYMALALLNADNVNGFPQTWLLLAGITWSLRWEWHFYGSLLLTAFAARRPGLHLPFTLAAMVGTAVWAIVSPSNEANYILLFSIGMVCASAQANGYTLRAPQAALSVAVLVLTAGCFLLSPGNLTVWAVFLIGGAFYLVAVAGATLSGVLTNRAVMRLGEISFGIYMLHGLALATVLRSGVGRFAAETSPALYWLLVMGALVLTLASSLLAHIVVEKPGISLGHSLARHRSARHGGGRALEQPTA